MGRGTEVEAIEVEISDTQAHLRVVPEELAALARSVLLAEGRRRASISIALVDQAAIHTINREHLGHDWPTDVISFDLSEPGDVALTGELVVSAEMAATTAGDLGVEPGDELALYVVHGLLHLCGHEDVNELGTAAMRRREDELLRAVGRSSPFYRGVQRDGSPGDLAGPLVSIAARSSSGRAES
ncbi:MAG: rRNA maturation RNase YbeY [Isosphaeraceae bacterium]